MRTTLGTRAASALMTSIRSSFRPSQLRLSKMIANYYLSKARRVSQCVYPCESICQELRALSGVADSSGASPKVRFSSGAAALAMSATLA